LLSIQRRVLVALLQLQQAVAQDLRRMQQQQQQPGAWVVRKQLQNQQQLLVTAMYPFPRQSLRSSKSQQQQFPWSRTQQAQVSQLSTSAQLMWPSNHSSSSKLCSPLPSSSSNSSRVSHR
jgi:hypothetical protein